MEGSLFSFSSRYKDGKSQFDEHENLRFLFRFCSCYKAIPYGANVLDFRHKFVIDNPGRPPYGLMFTNFGLL